MGRIFLDHIGGTRLFSCANCDTILTNRSELISTRFTGATGRAFLFNKARGEPAVQRGAGPRDADRQTHGARRQLQELQQQAGLDLRVRHRGQPALQGGPRDPGESAGARERGLRGARPVRRVLSTSARRDSQLFVRPNPDFSSLDSPVNTQVKSFRCTVSSVIG